MPSANNLQHIERFAQIAVAVQGPPLDVAGDCALFGGGFLVPTLLGSGAGDRRDTSSLHLANHGNETSRGARNLNLLFTDGISSAHKPSISHLPGYHIIHMRRCMTISASAAFALQICGPYQHMASSL